jgi:hypothetical protein
LETAEKEINAVDMMQHIYKERVKNDGSIEEGFKNLEDIVKRIYPRLF